MKTLNERHHQTLGGHQAQALSNHLSALNEKLKASHGIDTTPGYISLVGCSLADKDGEGSKSYVQQLGEALHQKAGWRLEMGARQLPVSVNEEGRKMSVVKGANRPVSDKSDKIVFNWAPQNEFVPKNSLTARVNGLLTVMDSLALGKQTIGALDEQQWRDAADFFHHSDGQFDFIRFMLTVKTLRRYRVRANEALQLLQLGDAHRQLEPLSGQEALIKSQAWHVTQTVVA